MITYETFEKHMNDIIALNDLDDRLMDALCGTEAEVYFPSLIPNVVDLLADATEDNYGWIEYWVYELNCGKKYEDGMVKGTDDSIIPLRTVRDLWNILQSTGGMTNDFGKRTV